MKGPRRDPWVWAGWGFALLCTGLAASSSLRALLAEPGPQRTIDALEGCVYALAGCVALLLAALYDRMRAVWALRDELERERARRRAFKRAGWV